ncbi:MAG: Gx transporter family protein [Clostridia bacterium]|nr:Gx transporter family protein [Clostridia bacterium]
MTSQKIAKIGIICAVSVILGYIESLLPPFIPVVGFKIGLANIAVMYALYKIGYKEAFFVMLTKVLITALWFSGLNSFIFSLLGGILSYFAMVTAKRLKLSQIGVGMAGGVFHNVGQILAACVVLGTYNALFYMVYLLPLGLLTGALVAAATKLLLKYTKKI